MKHGACIITISVCLAGMALSAFAQTPPTVPTLPGPDDPVKIMVGRLELEKYKATLKGLAQFGDRRQGTERNRKAVYWIEAQLKRYGCPTGIIKYDYAPAPRGTGQRAGAAADDAADEGARGAQLGAGAGAGAAGRGGG